MATDEERREVARRLRELAGKYVTLGELGSILGIDLTSGKVDICRDTEDLNRLADLIEPSLQCPYYDSSRHYCSVHDVVVDRETCGEES